MLFLLLFENVTEKQSENGKRCVFVCTVDTCSTFFAVVLLLANSFSLHLPFLGWRREKKLCGKKGIK